MIKKISAILVALGLLLQIVSVVQAADLTTAMIRLDRTAFSTSPGNILITAQTGENVTEDGVRVVVGSSWSISGTASNFTVSTSNLPAGVTAWPGIGTATGVAGNTITFPSSTINSGTTYGFYLTGGITTNPSSATENGKVWEVATLVGGSPSSTKQVGVSLTSGDQVTVSGTILPPVSDFSTETEALTAGADFPQETTLDYQVTYGSTYDYDTDLTLQVEWSLGTVQGSSDPTVDILEYVTGTATNAYGSTAPVIDTVNRTITWDISDFPAETTDQTVTFSLRTKAGYTGNLPVSFDVSSRIIDPITTSDSTVTQTYLYVDDSDDSGTPGAKSICDQHCESNADCDTDYCLLPEKRCRNQGNPSNLTCQSLPASSTSTTSSPTISSTSIGSVSDQQATIIVRTAQQTSAFVRYGTSPQALNNQSAVSENKTVHSILLSSLQSNTTYYFQIIISNANGSQTSDIFTFRTTAQSNPFSIERLIVSSDGLTLFAGDPRARPNTILPIPFIKDYEVALQIDSPILFQTAKVIAEEESTGELVFESLMSASQENVWNAQIPSTTAPERYLLTFYGIDEFGNITTEPLVFIHAIHPLRVTHSVTRQPIEGASLEFFQFDFASQTYKGIIPNTLLRENPTFTNESGIGDVVLPLGKYKVIATKTGFESIELEFEVTANSSELPQIDMQPIPSNPFTTFKNLREGFTSMIANIDQFFMDIARDPEKRAMMNVGVVLLTVLTIMIFLLEKEVFAFGLTQFLKNSTFLPRIIKNIVKTVFGAVIVIAFFAQILIARHTGFQISGLPVFASLFNLVLWIL